jgi:hypothetical protein
MKMSAVDYGPINFGFEAINALREVESNFKPFGFAYILLNNASTY